MNIAGAPPSLGEPGLHLALQGGAMRVSYTLGALERLKGSKLGSRVLSISCSSAGTIAGLAYACADLESFSATLFDMLSGDRFINPRRFWRVVDVNYLVDDVVMPHLELDLLAEVGSPHIWVTLTNSVSGELTRVLATPHNAGELLRATMAIPVLYGTPVVIPALNSRFVDGGIAEPIPLFQALSMASSGDVAVVVANKPLRLSGDHSIGTAERLCLLVDPRVSSCVRRALLGPNPLEMMLMRAVDEGQYADCRVVACQPDESYPAMSRTCTDLEVLEAFMQRGKLDGDTLVARLLSAEP